MGALLYLRASNFPKWEFAVAIESVASISAFVTMPNELLHEPIAPLKQS